MISLFRSVVCLFVCFNNDTDVYSYTKMEKKRLMNESIPLLCFFLVCSDLSG